MVRLHSRTAACSIKAFTCIINETLCACADCIRTEATIGLVVLEYGLKLESGLKSVLAGLEIGLELQDSGLTLELRLGRSISKSFLKSIF